MPVMAGKSWVGLLEKHVKSENQMKLDRRTRVALVGLIAMAALSASGQAPEPTLSSGATLSDKPAALFGNQPGHRFNGTPLSAATISPRTDTLTLTIAPGKGVQVRTQVDAGQGFVFLWTATADLFMDMHGEPAESAETYTAYAIGAKQRQASGTFVAPFTGKHGWYWQNPSLVPVTVKVVVTGFQRDLLRAVIR